VFYDERTQVRDLKKIKKTTDRDTYYHFY